MDWMVERAEAARSRFLVRKLWVALLEPRILGCYKGQRLSSPHLREGGERRGDTQDLFGERVIGRRRPGGGRCWGEPSHLQRCAGGRVCFLRCITLATGEPRVLNCPGVSMSGDQNRAGCRDLVAVDLRMCVLLCQERPCGGDLFLAAALL